MTPSAVSRSCVHDADLISNPRVLIYPHFVFKIHMARRSSDAPQVFLHISTAFPEVIEQRIEKEVARSEEKEIVEDLAYGLSTEPDEYSNERAYASDLSPYDVEKKKRRLSSLICATIVILVCLGVGLRVGLGLGLQTNKYMIVGNVQGGPQTM
jgi:hypothetical protein